MNKQAIAKKLIELRGNKSREEVAKALKISTSALAMYEQGERIPRDHIKARISKYYKRSVDFIFFAHIEHEKCTKESNESEEEVR
ncbi:putative transcriptional regulator [Aequitasia blattaphilus]|uniref:Helix-turn-helix domain-containing protein n=1 Tax=Aequitasia blattaphilus TaxID=2949332 RepID=A0ABT1ECJ0_9FIRM|nr:helix-turn-helix transcriptional regulator [Aequitasia blattaphilus]MCP1103561.1 helix-turn-helix domain-containing protein [Aequitasia blattaphilus]MCR8616201.1 helix-turn-helix domain-containing protein [Aequitasia blattaphilus]